MTPNRIADMTVGELTEFIDSRIHAEVTKLLDQQNQAIYPKEQLTLDDFPVDDLGPWPEGLTLRREEMYDEDR